VAASTKSQYKLNETATLCAQQRLYANQYHQLISTEQLPQPAAGTARHGHPDGRGGRVIDGDQQKMTTPAISAQTANRHPNHTQPRWRLRVAQ